MIGYADENFLLSPTIDGLQEMLKTCEDYAKEHNLVFSTDPSPIKSKTKCIAYLKTERICVEMIFLGLIPANILVTKLRIQWMV